MNGKPNQEFMVEISRMKWLFDFNYNHITLDELYKKVLNFIKNEKNLLLGTLFR